MRTTVPRSLAPPMHLRVFGGRGLRTFQITPLPMSEPLTSESTQPSVAAVDLPQPPTPAKSWRSEELLGERTEVLIVHGSEVYRLRRTRQDKLILYK